MVDPPRTGLAPRGRKKDDACVSLIRSMPDLNLLIYMSCSTNSVHLHPFAPLPSNLGQAAALE